MSVNRFMHPRNIYKTPPDFTQLALNYPKFKEISKVKLNGKVTVDFTDSNTIRTLTQCLLKKDFGLDVELPQNKLVPTLPLRLNYILWIEDLVNLLSDKNNVQGIDIGCGASCIYPLLMVKMNSWNMIGLESDEDSSKMAQQNVNTNNLASSIQIITTYGNSDIFTTLGETQFTFCMCNPPFYNFDCVENNNNRTGHRKPPKNGFTGVRNELYTDGGEVKFASQIITESLKLRTRIQIYTTMLGHKSSVNQLVDILKSNEIKNYQKTEFCQGNTTRWGLAWTFDESINLVAKSVVATKSHQENYILTHELISADINYAAAIIKLEYILNILLKFDIKIIKNIESKLKVYEIVAHDTSWLNYRRRKRELLKKTEPQCDNEINSSIELLAVPEPKRLKLEQSEFILKCNVCLRNKQADGKIMLELSFTAGAAGKNGMHQLMLFLSNRFKEDIKCDDKK